MRFSRKKPLTQTACATTVEAEKVEENLYECHHLKAEANIGKRLSGNAGLANIKPPRPACRPLLKT